MQIALNFFFFSWIFLLMVKFSCYEKQNWARQEKNCKTFLTSKKGRQSKCLIISKKNSLFFIWGITDKLFFTLSPSQRIYRLYQRKTPIFSSPKLFHNYSKLSKHKKIIHQLLSSSMSVFSKGVRLPETAQLLSEFLKPQNASSGLVLRPCI